MNVHELWDVADQLVRAMRLPPQFTIRLAPKYDHDDVVITIVGTWPDVNDPARTVQTYSTMHLAGYTAFSEPRVLLIDRLAGEVRELWDHELDEWLTIDGVHVRPPHEPGHPQMIRGLVDLHRKPLA